MLSKKRNAMTACHKIVTWLTIVLFTICSTRSFVEADNNTVCYMNVIRKESYQISYTEPVEHPLGIWFRGAMRTRYNVTYRNVTVKEARCCPGYENKSQLCEPQCIPKCINGYCAQPNICKCSYGWAEDLCNKTLLCIIRLNLTGAESSVPTSSENTGLERGRPECNPKCDDSSISELMDSGNSTYKFLSIDAQCNTKATAESFWKTTNDSSHHIVVPPNPPYNSIYIGIGTLMGIILFLVIVFYVIRVVQKKRRMNEFMKNIYDDCETEPKPAPQSEPTTHTHLNGPMVGPQSVFSYESNPASQLEYDYVDPKTMIESACNLSVRSEPKSERTIHTHLNDSMVRPPFIVPYKPDPVPQFEYDYVDPQTIIK